MGFRYRKTITILPGVRLTFSKSGIGISAGVKGARVTRHASGRVSRTLSLPGSGMSHVTTVRPSPRARVRGPAAAADAEGRESLIAGQNARREGHVGVKLTRARRAGAPDGCHRPGGSHA